MKICIYSSAFYPSTGGIENFVYLLAKEFVKLGHKVTIFTDTIIKFSDIEFPFKVVRSKSFISKIKVFGENDIILLNNFSFKSIPAAILSLKSFFIVHHSAYHLNGIPLFSVEYILSYLKTRFCFFFKNISVSKFISKSLPVSSKIIYNTFNNSDFKKIKINKKKRDFIFCGRLVSDKGTNVLIDAFFQTLKKYKNSHLTIVGNGPELIYLKNQSTKLGLNKNIEFFSFLSNKILNKKFNEHFCMIIPSLWNEPFGSVALEGLATTDFIISSNRGGLPEAVKNFGVLVDPTIKNLSEQMINFLKNKNKILMKMKKYSKIKQKHLKKHSSLNVAKNYIRYFSENI